MQKIFFLLVIFLSSNTHQACASDQTAVVKTDQYDQTATDKLKKVLRGACESTWTNDCIEIKGLVELRADPNAQPQAERRLLHVAALQNDPTMVAFGLKHGGCAHVLPGENDAPLMEACSSQVAQLLLDNKASLDCFRYGDNLLHNAIVLERSTDFLIFLCNAGIDPQAKNSNGDTYLHKICSESHLPLSDKRFLEIVAVLSFLQEDSQVKNRNGETPMGRLKKHSPKFVEPAQEIISATQRFKKQLQLEQEQVGPLVSTHILPTLTPFVIGYAGLDKVRWKEGDWPRIQSQLTPATKAVIEKGQGL